MSDNALYLYKVLQKYLKGFQGYRPKESRVDPRVVANVDRRMNGWKTGSQYRTMPEAGTTKMKKIKNIHQKTVEMDLSKGA